MNLSRQYSFWSSLSPLGGLTGASLLVIASARLSWAITVAGSLFWVYGLSTLTYAFLLSSLGHSFFPVHGRFPVFTCVASFFSSVYILLFWLLCPFAALEVFLPLLLVPLFCAASGIIQNITPAGIPPEGDAKKQGAFISQNSSSEIFDHISNAVSQAVSLSILLIVFAIIREPLSYSSLSFPGTYQGMITIMYFRENAFFPIGIFSHSAGAFILLGYVTCLYQYGKAKLFPGEHK